MKKPTIISINSKEFLKAVQDAVEREKSQPGKWRFQFDFVGERVNDDNEKEVEISIIEVPQNSVYKVFTHGQEGCVVLSKETANYKDASRLFRQAINENAKTLYTKFTIKEENELI